MISQWRNENYKHNHVPLHPPLEWLKYKKSSLQVLVRLWSKCHAHQLLRVEIATTTLEICLAVSSKTMHAAVISILGYKQ